MTMQDQRKSLEAGNHNNIGDFDCIRERLLSYMRFIMLVLVFAICDWYFFCFDAEIFGVCLSPGTTDY